MKNKNNLILGLAAAGAVALSISMIMKSRRNSNVGQNVHELLDDVSLRLNRFLAERNEKNKTSAKQNHPSNQAVSLG